MTIELTSTNAGEETEDTVRLLWPLYDDVDDNDDYYDCNDDNINDDGDDNDNYYDGDDINDDDDDDINGNEDDDDDDDDICKGKCQRHSQ